MGTADFREPAHDSQPRNCIVVCMYVHMYIHTSGEEFNYPISRFSRLWVMGWFSEISCTRENRPPSTRCWKLIWFTLISMGWMHDIWMKYVHLHWTHLKFYVYICTYTICTVPPASGACPIFCYLSRGSKPCFTGQSYLGKSTAGTAGVRNVLYKIQKRDDM